MQYSGYSEGTFSSQINDFRIKNNSLENQVIELQRILQIKENTIIHLQNLLRDRDNLESSKTSIASTSPVVEKQKNK